jgi:mevalonate pyrophosphate decarboxylase
MKIQEKIVRDYILGEKDCKIRMTLIDNDFIEIKTYNERDEFVFNNEYTENTLDKWDRVLSLMKEAVKIARKKLQDYERKS